MGLISAAILGKFLILSRPQFLRNKERCENKTRAITTTTILDDHGTQTNIVHIITMSLIIIL